MDTIVGCGKMFFLHYLIGILGLIVGINDKNDKANTIMSLSIMFLFNGLCYILSLAKERNRIWIIITRIIGFLWALSVYAAIPFGITTISIYFTKRKINNVYSLIMICFYTFYYCGFLPLSFLFLILCIAGMLL